MVPNPTVAIHIDHWLTPAMTFVHRQVLGVAERFPVVVIAESVAHRDLFPIDAPVHVVPATRAGALACRASARARGRFAGLTPLQRWRCARLLRREDARLVHAHFGPPGVRILPVARGLGLPLIVTFHGYDASSLLALDRYVRSLRGLFDEAFAVVAVSHFMAARLRAHGAPAGDRLRVLHYGIPVRDFPKARREPPRAKRDRGAAIEYLQVASLVEKKGHEVLLHAFAEVRRLQPASRLVLAGEGPRRPAIEALRDALGLADAVEMPGRVTIAQVAELAARADVFVHPSVTAANGDEEGIPNVIMEAMSTGLPVVSTTHAGIPELVTSGVDGLLVPERDAGALAAAMLDAVERGSELGDAAAATIRARFDLARQNAALRDLYDEALAPAGASR